MSPVGAMTDDGQEIATQHRLSSMVSTPVPTRRRSSPSAPTCGPSTRWSMIPTASRALPVKRHRALDLHRLLRTRYGLVFFGVSSGQ